MNSIAHINVAKEFDKILTSREVVSEIVNQIMNLHANQVELDFTDVEFISRSFADQFFKEKLKLMQELQILVEVRNANIEVSEMLKAVANTQNVSDRKNNSINFLQLKDLDALKNHLWDF